ncbi:hypothetical protein BH23CHL7_BH23CHL7_16070 [soil metagenome]
MSDKHAAEPGLPAELNVLLAEARVAPPRDVVPRYWSAIASFGVDAIAALEPWLTLDSMRGFAVVTIREAVRRGGDIERDAACTALLSATNEVPPWAREYLRKELARLGCEIPVDSFPTGTTMTPTAPGLDAHHAIVDRIRESSTEFRVLHLAACRWVFSDKWVQEHGGLLSSASAEPCYFCRLELAKAGSR